MESKLERPYLASAYTIGDQGRNMHKAMTMYAEVLALGCWPYMPLLNHYLNIQRPFPPSVWMELDKVWLCHCDSMIRLPGESRGADEEERLAVAKGFPVFYSVHDFAEARKLIAKPVDRGWER